MLLTESKSLEKLISIFQKRNPNIDIEGLKQLLLSDPTIVSNDRGTFYWQICHVDWKFIC